MVEAGARARALRRARAGRDRRRAPDHRLLRRPLHLDRRGRRDRALRGRALDPARRAPACRDLETRMEASLLGRNVKLVPRRRAAEDAADDRRRQLGDHDPVRVLGHRARAGCSARDARARPPAARPRGDRAHARRARHHRRRGASSDALGESAPGRGRQLRRLHGRRRRRGRRARPRWRSTTPRAGLRGRGRRARRARRSSTPPPTTSSTARKRNALRGVRRDRAAISAYGRSKQAGETSVAISNPRHFIVADLLALRRRRPELRRDDAARSAREQPEVMVVADQVGCPTYTPPPRRGRSSSCSRPSEYGIHHIAGAGRCSWYEFAQEIFDQAGVDVPRPARHDRRDARRPAPRPALLACSAASAPTRSRCPTGARACASTSPSARERGRRHEAPGHRRRRASSAPPTCAVASSATRTTRCGCSTSSPTPGGARTSRDLDASRLELVEGDIADAEARGGGDRRLRRGRQLRRRDARRPLDRGARASSSRPTSSARSSCSRPPARRGDPRYLQVSTDEVYGSIDDGLVHRELAARPLLALLGLEGGRRPAGRRLPPHLRHRGARSCRGSNNYGPRQHPEKLIPLCVLNALAGTRCRSTATACRSATGSSSRTSRPRDRPGARARPRRRGLQRRRARRAGRTSTSCAASSSSPAATSR